MRHDCYVTITRVSPIEAQAIVFISVKSLPFVGWLAGLRINYWTDFDKIWLVGGTLAQWGVAVAQMEGRAIQ